MSKLSPTTCARRPLCGVRRHVCALNWETCLPVPRWRPVTAMPQPTVNRPAILDGGGKHSATPLSPAPATPRTLLRRRPPPRTGTFQRPRQRPRPRRNQTRVTAPNQGRKPLQSCIIKANQGKRRKSLCHHPLEPAGNQTRRIFAFISRVNARRIRRPR